MARSKPTVISTFAGVGGSSLGYRWAGYRELLAVDFDAHAAECFRLNFPGVPCWQRGSYCERFRDLRQRPGTTN